ncbi:MAG: tetratricopeptide repeat protein [Alphaproteobacteria bacterium]|nr:tetratricopeptide repeat protein [Alphaproteobacteria bacterium]
MLHDKSIGQTSRAPPSAGAEIRSAAEHAFAEAVRQYRAGNPAEAFRLAAHAAELDPTFSEASLELARLLSAARRFDEAEQVLRSALDAVPRHFGLASNLGVLLCQTNRAAEGLDWLQRACDIQPDSAMAHYNVANALKTLSRLDEAVASYRAALARDPNLAGAYGNLGNSLAELGRPLEAAAAHQKATALRRDPRLPPLAGDEFATRTSAGKLRHDVEQIEYLLARGAIGPEHERVLADYRAVAAALPPPAAGTHIVELPAPLRERLAGTYNRLWHKYEPPALAGSALDPALDRPAIEADYARNHPGITHVDAFLRPEALAELRRFCLESTVWFQFKYANGYLGAYWEAGFWCPLLEQVSEELRLALPGIFRHHKLRKCWAFKYDSRLSGIPMHADFAAVNVNFWITPDQANLDPDRGGLVVWDKEAPSDWDFADYNANETAMRSFLARSGARPVRIPHRQNRMVIFNSDLFHETDRITFAEGYENRRINITLLYGARGA